MLIHSRRWIQYGHEGIIFWPEGSKRVLFQITGTVVDFLGSTFTQSCHITGPRKAPVNGDNKDFVASLYP